MRAARSAAARNSESPEALPGARAIAGPQSSAPRCRAVSDQDRQAQHVGDEGHRHPQHAGREEQQRPRSPAPSPAGGCSPGLPPRWVRPRPRPRVPCWTRADRHQLGCRDQGAAPHRGKANRRPMLGGSPATVEQAISGGTRQAHSLRPVSRFARLAMAHRKPSVCAACPHPGRVAAQHQRSRVASATASRGALEAFSGIHRAFLGHS
jgi:hypothetical protein